MIEVPMSALLIIALCLTPQQTDDAAATLSGNWQGSLHVQVMELRLGFKIKKLPEGKLSGTMVSIDQGNAELSLTLVEQKDGTVKLGILSAMAQFEGKLSSDG